MTIRERLGIKNYLIRRTGKEIIWDEKIKKKKNKKISER